MVKAGSRTTLSVAIAFVAIAATAAIAQVTQVIQVSQGAPPGQSSQNAAIPDPQPGTGILFGQAIDATSRKPVAGAIVTISGSTIPVAGPDGAMVSRNPLATTPTDVPRQVMTGGTGQFVFRALPAGRYTLRVSAPGYVAGTFGQVRPGGSGQSVELTKDDEKRGDLTIRMWKTASISGRVIDEAGEGMIGLNVSLIRRTTLNGRVRYSMDRSVATDDRGVYRLSGLTPGDYAVGVISTQATMPAATVDAYYQMMMSGGSSTADLTRELSSSDAPYPGGSGVRIGDFVLSPSRGIGAIVPTDDARLMYATQFYPAASAPAQATGITLGSGEERTGIDLQLKPVPTMRVSGVATGPDGPIRNLGLRLMPAAAADFTSDTSLDAAVTATDANGAFTFLGVPPGQYMLKSLRVPQPVRTPLNPSTMIEISVPGGGMMMSSSGPAAAADVQLPTDPTLYGSMPLTVREADITGLVLPLHTGARVSGRIVFDGTSPPPAPDLMRRVSISISPVAGGTFSGSFSLSSSAKRIETDGRFATVGYAPGTYSVSAFAPSTPNSVTWRFRSATVGGKDVTDGGLVVDAGDVSDLVLTFVDRSSDVSGMVLDAKGQPDRTATVIILPADSQAWKEQGSGNGRRVRSSRANSNGVFTIADLPPGSYFIAAVAEESLANWQDPKTLEAISRVATTFSLKDGEKLTQSLTTRVIR
ncbi:MAG TPA: carboxypeptidase-like regulatory domain-containing protein [Vicinamibacterales bacterium]|nr:carboxypeptidase-like regulatory domain-containing protein [Vicinamibacterales bacterium]